MFSVTHFCIKHLIDVFCKFDFFVFQIHYQWRILQCYQWRTTECATTKDPQAWRILMKCATPKGPQQWRILQCATSNIFGKQKKSNLQKTFINCLFRGMCYRKHLLIAITLLIVLQKKRIELLIENNYNSYQKEKTISRNTLVLQFLSQRKGNYIN